MKKGRKKKEKEKRRRNRRRADSIWGKDFFHRLLCNIDICSSLVSHTREPLVRIVLMKRIGLEDEIHR